MSKLDFDYRRAKKILNRYHTFSFRMPSEKKGFNGMQKSVIRRVYNRLAQSITREKNGEGTFIKKVKGFSPVDSVKTNKGYFFKYGNAKVVKTKKPKRGESKYIIKTSFGKRREIFIPFPKSIANDLLKIKTYVNKQAKRYKPDYIRWSVNGYKGSTYYDVEAFNLYVTNETKQDSRLGKALKEKQFFSGVFFGYDPNLMR